MMRTLYRILLVLITVVGLSSCGYRNSTMTPTIPQSYTYTVLPSTSTATLEPFINSDATITPTPSQVAISTNSVTMEPKQAQETIEASLKVTEDCDPPCFLGVTPGETTSEQALKILTRLGLMESINSTKSPDETIDNESFGLNYKFDSGLSLFLYVTVQDKLVTDLEIKIAPEESQENMPREWLAYSPESLISHYGSPSRISFFIDWGPRTPYAMTFYYNDLDLIVDYFGYEIIGGPTGSLQVCPLTDPYDTVQIWIGEEPMNPLLSAVPLETAASMTIEEFAERMTGEPENACIDLIKDAFIP